MIPAGRTERLEAFALGFAFFASVLGFASIAASQICLGAALALMLVLRKRLEMPPLKGPLFFFMGWTAIAVVASDDMVAGLPQLKKFAVVLMLPLVYTFFRTTAAATKLMEGWFAVGAISVAAAVAQFWVKWREAVVGGYPFLQGYEGDRTTGLMSHWMTFSETTLLILVVCGSYLLFRSPSRSGGVLWGLISAWLAAGILLSYTRSAWIAAVVVGVYLVWCWRPRLLWLAPVAVGAVGLVAPTSIMERVQSITSPYSNSARIIMWRTGWRMILDHPLFGVGPERVGPTFSQYLPSDVPEDLPTGYYAHLHNTFVHYAAERGLPIVLALLWLFGKVLWDMGRALRRAPPGAGDARFLLHAAVAATVALFIIGLFNVSMGDSEVMGAWLAVVGVGYRAAETV